MPSLPPAGQPVTKQPAPKPAAPKPAPKPAPTSMTPTQWAQLVAQDLGINVSQDPNAVLDILGWMPHEEPASSWWGGYGSPTNPTRINPLNAGDIGKYGYAPSPLTGNTLSGGLGTYATLTDAAAASADMLRQSNMSAALAGLKRGDAPAQFTQDINATPWAGRKYSTITPGQVEAEAQGPTVRARLGSGQPGGGASAVAGALASQTNPAIIAQQNAAEAIQQSLQLTPAELAAQQQILKENYGYSQQQFDIQGQELGLGMHEAQSAYNQTIQNRQFQMGQDALSGKAITDAINNIIKQFGFQQQQLQIQTQQGLQSEAASGVYNTGTRRQFLGQQALTSAEQTATEQYQLQQERLAQQSLGITEQQHKAQYGYALQQAKDGMKKIQLQQESLGISRQQARAQYQNALQQLDLNSIMGADQLEQQIATLAGGGYSPLAGMIGQLQQLIPGLAGAMGGSGSSLTAGGGNTTGG